MRTIPSVVTFVATSRNDDHGGDLRGRMQQFVDGLNAQCRRHNLPGELIMVEWNPPLDRPPLADALRWPDDGGLLGVRVVTVPPDVHEALDHAQALPLFQMIAKNVGIRRARGEFVVATNIDILFSDGVMEAMAHHLRSGHLFRADRHDVIPHPPPGLPFDEALTACDRCTIRINRREGTFLVPEQQFLPIYMNFRQVLWAWLWRQVVRSVRLVTMRPARAMIRKSAWLWRQVVRVLRFFVLRPAQGLRRLPSRFRDLRRLGDQREPLPRLFVRGLRLLPSRIRQWRQPSQRVEKRGRTPLQVLAVGARRLKYGVAGLFFSPVYAWRELRDAWSVTHRLPRLHTNGCGDFTVLSRDDWFALRGYPEWHIFSWHLDSVLLYQALASGIRMVDLPHDAPVFHLEHGKGSGFTPEGEVLLFSRLRDSEVPFLSTVDFSRIAIELFDQTSGSATFNDESWGMVNFDLPEIELTRPDWAESGASDTSSRSSGTRQGPVQR